jgi:hypothetical protein
VSAPEHPLSDGGICATIPAEARRALGDREALNGLVGALVVAMRAVPEGRDVRIVARLAMRDEANNYIVADFGP